MLSSRTYRVGKFIITVSRQTQEEQENKMTEERGEKGERGKREGKKKFLQQLDERGQVYFVVICPHCQDPILLYKNEIACKIFRHAAYLDNANNLINPHTSEKECKR